MKMNSIIYLLRVIAVFSVIHLNTLYKASQAPKIDYKYYLYYHYPASSTKAKSYLELLDLQFSMLSSTLKNPIHHFKHLSEPFLFYGNKISALSVSSNGYLYMHEWSGHPYLNQTQFIAPLMADFNISLSNSSKVFYSNPDDTLYIYWKDMAVNNQDHRGSFSFQIALSRNGSIIFAYKQIPFPISEISSASHPLSVGLSDSYYSDTKVNGIIRRMIIRYSQIQLPPSDVEKGVVIQLTALPTCVEETNCEACHRKHSNFLCAWCPELALCSSGLDRNYQRWTEKKCDKEEYQASSCQDAPMNLPLIIGCCVGGVVLIAVIIVFGVCCRRKNSKKKNTRRCRPTAPVIEFTQPTYNLPAPKTTVDEAIYENENVAPPPRNVFSMNEYVN